MKCFFESQFFSSIIGVIIGGVLGFGSSYYIYRSRIKAEIKNITQGFYIEICSLEDEILTYANIIKNSPKKIFRIINDIYPDGLYFHAPSDIFKLDSESSKLLFTFYNSLIKIDRLNKITDDSMFKVANEEGTKQILIRINDELLPELKKRLKNDN